MEIQVLDHINMTVTNMGETLDWYKSLFGFRTVETGIIEGRPWSIISSGDARLCIYETKSLSSYDPDHASIKGMNRMNHFGFRITNEQEWLQILEKFHPVVLYDGNAIKYPHSKSWYLRDPNGYHIEVSIWKNNEVHFS